MISYTFPPALEPGAIRASKMAKYLPQCGCQPIVVTSAGGFAYAVGLEEPGSSVEIVRVKDPDPVKRLMGGTVDTATGVRSRSIDGKLIWQMKRYYSQLVFPDRDFLWGLRAALAAVKITKSRRIDAVYSSSPNMTNHLAAYIVHRRTSLPWIAEFRDLWSDAGAYSSKWRWRYRAERYFEKLVLRKATRVVTISNELAQALQRQHSSVEAGKYLVVTNGYDEEDQAKLAQCRPTQEFVITYAGTLYGGKRDPAAFFGALQDFLSQDGVDRKSVYVDVIGKPESFVKDLARQHQLENNVRLVGLLPFSSTLDRLARSYLLILITNPSYPEMPLKIFDYFCARRPILAICSAHSELASRIQEANSGVVVEHSDLDGMKRHLRRYYEMWRAGESGYEGLQNKLLQYRRSVIAKQLAEVIKGCSGQNRAADSFGSAK